jgi:hypothetical protein
LGKGGELNHDPDSVISGASDLHSKMDHTGPIAAPQWTTNGEGPQ